MTHEYTIDAEGKRLGRLASEVAVLLMGKQLPDFARNKVPSVSVTVDNIDLLDITAKKKAEKTYDHYTGYPYTQALGRRKTAVARVRLYPAKKTEVFVNGKACDDYFGTDELRLKARQALLIDEQKEHYTVSAYVKGSGPNAQSEAIRLGVARALVSIDEELRSPLKSKGYLKRDPRSVERKKFGLLKARKAPAWVKR